MESEDRPSAMVVEDDDTLRSTLQVALTRLGLEVAPFGDPASAMLALEESDPDVILTDLQLGDGASGLDVCRELRGRRPDVPVIVMTAFGSLDAAVEAIRAGAYDFLTKPLDLEMAKVALDRAIDHRRLRREVRQLRRRARTSEVFEELVGDSAAMRTLFSLLDRVGDAPSSVLITGESGTGKELVARALHARSPRAAGPFVAINCAAVPEALLESELFGHSRGAFTDARATRTGLFVHADTGTLFLDEIGDMPLSLQAKLLRVLQDRRVRPVGSDRDVVIDVRVIAATHQDLEARAEEGRFREDLLYRLDVIRVELPPLRARGNDILLLGQRFVERYADELGRPVRDLSPEAARKLLDYEWPGNVRELQNAIERAVVLAPSDRIGVDDLPRKVQKAGPRSPIIAAMDDPASVLPLHEVEKRYILKVLDMVAGSRARAASLLQIDRKTLYRKLTNWDQDT